MIADYKFKKNCLNNFIHQSDQSLLISYKIALLIVKNNKTFKDGEFIKACLQTTISIMAPDLLKNIDNIPLSDSTIARRIEDLSLNCREQLQKKINKFDYYSLALDESLDIVDTPQLSIFIKGINEKFEITEELLKLIPLKKSTKATDIFEEIKNIVNEFKLDIKKLTSITTDGAPAMVGKKMD